MPSPVPSTSPPRVAALVAGFGALACSYGPGGSGGPGAQLGDGRDLASREPPLFIEQTPQLTTTELFGALRERGVDVWIAEDRRLGVRLHDGTRFEAVCELLARLDHDIESLELAYLPIDDLGPLMHVRSTERLDLSGARADLRPVRHLHRLRALSLAGTDFTSLAALAELDHLESLDLSGARANLVGIGQLDTLRELRLSQARTSPRGFEVRDGEGLELAALHDLSQLERLELSASKVRDWAPLAALWTVEHLDLSYTNFQDLGLLEHFAELEVLNLRRTAVVDLTPLAYLDALTQVDLRDCDLLDGASLQHLRATRPELELTL